MAREYVSENIRSIHNRNLGGYIKADVLGDWAKAKKLFDRLSKDLQDAIYGGQMDFAEDYKRAVKAHIRSGGTKLKWAAVSPKYSKFKSSSNKTDFGPVDLGRFTGNMYKAIEIYPGKKSVSIGISKSEDFMAHGGVLKTSQVARIFETGSEIRQIKARPLFAPTLHLMGGRAAITKKVINSINKELRRKHNITTS